MSIKETSRIVTVINSKIKNGVLPNQNYITREVY